MSDYRVTWEIDITVAHEDEWWSWLVLPLLFPFLVAGAVIEDVRLLRSDPSSALTQDSNQEGGDA